jgi:uncharacterized iron-regulated membrane protein
MTLAEQWKRRPQNVWLRRALFQIHLWTGIGVGLYVLAVSVSGSAIVFRNEVYSAAPTGPKTVAVGPHRLDAQEMREAIKTAFPGYSLSYLWQAKRPDQSVEVWLERNGHKKQRVFNPYTGQDLGEARPYSIQILAWMGDLHANLLGGPTGRIVNGIGSILVTLLCVTGAVLWWPGVASWRRNLKIGWRSNWKRINWDLHSAVGFWTFAFVFMWGLTGVYLVFPTPGQVFLNHFMPLDRYRPLSLETIPAPVLDRLPEPTLDPMLEPGREGRFVLVADAQPSSSTGAPAAAEKSPTVGTQVTPPAPRRRRAPPPHMTAGDHVIQWTYYLHFGNFAGWKVKTLWTVLGLVPVLLFFTGFIMWWNRVLGGEARRSRRAARLRGAGTEVPVAG